jgi:hypothetical protein
MGCLSNAQYRARHGIILLFAKSLTTKSGRVRFPYPSTTSEGGVFDMKGLWYKDAIIYCLDVETYQDSNGDGIGDFAELIQCLDYIANLGVTSDNLHL